jgi:hypothetical protein
VPNLLVAPSQNGGHTTSNGNLKSGSDPRGYYEDGAYTALPALDEPSVDNGMEDLDEEEEELDPQEAYYASLLNRFDELRALLHSDPPPLPKFSASHTQSPSDRASFLYTATHAQWRSSLLFSYPAPRLLCAMTQDCVLRGLSRLETLISSKNLLSDEGVTLGAWCWGLLGRCRNSGEMGSEEVAVIREVGKTALRVRRKIKKEYRSGIDSRDEHEQYGDTADGSVDADQGAEEEGEDTFEAMAKDDHADLQNSNGYREAPAVLVEDPERRINENEEPHEVSEEIEDGEISDDGDLQNPLALAKEQLLAQVRSPSLPSGDIPVERSFDTTQRALAMLDMIVTVVGEFYGQRDLLDGRDVWEE